MISGIGLSEMVLLVNGVTAVLMLVFCPVSGVLHRQAGRDEGDAAAVRRAEVSGGACTHLRYSEV